MSQDLLENCVAGYEYQLSELPTSIVIVAGLTPATDYIVKVADKFDNKYSTEAITSDGDGTLTFDLPVSFPSNWFYRNAGKFYFEVSETAVPWTPVELNLGNPTAQYTQIIVEFINDNGNINIIQ